MTPPLRKRPESTLVSGFEVHHVATAWHAKNETRVRWLLRQLPEGLEDVVIEASSRGRSQAASIEEVRAAETVLVPEAGRELTKFTVTKLYPLGIARSTRAKSSFISSAVDSVDDFYSQVLQNLKT